MSNGFHQALSRERRSPDLGRTMSVMISRLTMLDDVLSMHVSTLCAIKSGRPIVLCVLRKAVRLEASSIDSRADRGGIIVSHGRCVLRHAWAAAVSRMWRSCKIGWHRPAMTSLSDSRSPVVHWLTAWEWAAVLQSDSKLQVSGVAGPPSILCMISYKKVGETILQTLT